MSAVLAAACGGGGVAGPILDGFDPAPLSDDPAAAREWALSASAPRVLGTAQAPITAADLAIQLGEATCPVKTESGTTTTYEGGCTDAGGTQWRGRAEATASGFSYDGFGWTGVDDCNGQQVGEDITFDGEIQMSGGPTGFSFDIDIRFDGVATDEITCAQRNATGAISYSGELRQDDGDVDVWNGSGRVGTTIGGVADVETSDEVLNDAICGDEAVSGTTTIKAGDHTLAIRYDGATDCDADATVQWSFDGVDKGELTGVSCSAGGAPAWGLLFVVGAVILRRRRR